jgi:hypothetical protein
LKDEKLFFRALCFDAYIKETEEPVKFIDRVYGNEIMQQKIYDYCVNNQIAYRKFDSRTVFYMGNSVNIYVKSLSGFQNYGEEEGTAYIDTLYNYNPDKQILSNYNTSGGIDIQCCDGNALKGSECSICGCRVYEDESCCNDNGDFYCSDCYQEIYFNCESCGCDHLFEDATEINNVYYCKRCRDTDFTLCDDCGEWADITFLAEGKEICESCKDDYTYCDECGEYFKETTEVNYNYYCNDCLTAKFVECEDCGDWVETVTDGKCENCYVEVEEETEVK